MNFYAVEFVNKTGHVLLGYDDNEQLDSVKREIGLDETELDWLFRWVPRTIEDLNQKASNPKCTITPIEDDLSFEAFWNTYDHKVGNKGRCEKLWDMMQDAERALCLKKVRQYRYWLANKPGIEQAYPATFLHQRRWENDFKVK